MKNRITQSFAAVGLLVGAIGACGGDATGGDPSDYDVFLTIVGDRNQSLGYGVEQTLEVRYHDSADMPLAGEVRFDVIGNAAGSTLSQPAVTTNANGVAQVVIAAGTSDTTFQVKASAADAMPAQWTLTVDASALPKDAVGSYQVESVVDVATNMPGHVGNVVGTIVEMTDGPYDPATWIISEIDNSLLNSLKGVVEPILFELIQQAAPDLVKDLIAMGKQLGDMTRELGLVSILDVQAAQGGNQPYVANHTLIGFGLELGGMQTVYYMDELGVEETIATGVPFGFAGNNAQVMIGEHKLVAPYGGLLVLAVEDMLVPQIDPMAGNLLELFDNAIDCETFGKRAFKETDVLSAKSFAALCQTGVNAAAAEIVSQLRGVDNAAPVVFTISGSAVATEETGDGMVDRLTRGRWDGSIEYAGTTVPMVRDVNTFTARRRAN